MHCHRVDSSIASIFIPFLLAIPSLFGISARPYSLSSSFFRSISLFLHFFLPVYSNRGQISFKSYLIARNVVITAGAYNLYAK